MGNDEELELDLDRFWIADCILRFDRLKNLIIMMMIAVFPLQTPKAIADYPLKTRSPTSRSKSETVVKVRTFLNNL